MKFLTNNKLIALLLLIVAVGVIFVLTRGSGNASPNGIGEVMRMDLEQRVTISGQISPKRRLDVRPPFNGYVQKLFVTVGQKVKDGDPLVTFSPTLVGGERNYPVRSVFPGVVTQVLRTEGEFVGEQSEQSLVVRVEDLSSLFVLAAVAELDIAKIKRKQEALVRVSALIGETFPGEISEIALGARDKQVFSSSSAEFQIRVALKTQDPRLLPGMSVLMDVITDRRENVLALAHEYIHEDSEGYHVFTADGTRKNITLGLQTEEAAEIKSGLAEGERVRVIDFLNLPRIEE